MEERNFLECNNVTIFEINDKLKTKNKKMTRTAFISFGEIKEYRNLHGYRPFIVYYKMC